MTHSSATLILERILMNLVSTIPVYVALVAGITVSTGWISTSLIVILAYYTYTRVHLAFYDLVGVRWTVESGYFSYTRGLIFQKLPLFHLMKF